MQAKKQFNKGGVYCPTHNPEDGVFVNGKAVDMKKLLKLPEGVDGVVFFKEDIVDGIDGVSAWLYIGQYVPVKAMYLHDEKKNAAFVYRDTVDSRAEIETWQLLKHWSNSQIKKLIKKSGFDFTKGENLGHFAEWLLGGTLEGAKDKDKIGDVTIEYEGVLYRVEVKASFKSELFRPSKCKGASVSNAIATIAYC